jgi:dolichol-phosphate mannosyltransferase
MKTASPSLTVIILMYNEEENIGDTLEETRAFLMSEIEDWEILVVDDGSNDGSAQVVRDFSRKDGRIRLLRHETNRGMGAGIATGIDAATKEYFTFNAADGQIPAAQLGKMIPCLDDGDIVLTTYEGGRESFGREILSRSFRLFLKAITGIRFRLEGIYLFPTEAAREIRPSIDATTFFFSFELIQRGIEHGLTTTMTQIECKPRRSGSSKIVNPSRISKVAFDALRFGRKRRLRS